MCLTDKCLPIAAYNSYIRPTSKCTLPKSRNDFPVFREDLIHELVGKKGEQRRLEEDGRERKLHFD